MKTSGTLTLKIAVAFLLSTRHLLGAGELPDGIPPSPPATDLVRFDFETGDLQGWVIVEEGFGKLVTDRDAPYLKRPTGKQGRYFLSSCDTLDGTPDDGLTGIVESPVFELTGPEMSFLFAGATNLHTYVALCTLDDTEVLKAYGKTFTDTLELVNWSAPHLVGQKVFLRFVDKGYFAYEHLFFDNFQAHGRIDTQVTAQRFGIDLQRKRTKERFDEINLTSLRLAIVDLTQTFPREYPDASELLTPLATYQDQLPAIEERILSGNEQALSKADKAITEILDFQFAALVANPLLSECPILFTVRRPYPPGHHNTETLFQNGQRNEYRQGFGGRIRKFAGGSALKCIDFGNAGKISTLLDLPEGIVRDPEVHFDGDKIVLSIRRNLEDDYHIYEIDRDGNNLKQLTYASRVSDFDPLYLADDSIAFSSTREPKFCGCNRHIMANIYRMDADGANIHQITRNALFDGHGSLLPDGRILYSRWEYVDRNFGDAQGLWTVNVDGTNQALYWGNNTASPGAVLDARIIPGTQRTICTFSSCHSRPWGALAIIDRRLALDGDTAVEHVWPASVRDIISAQSGLHFDPYQGHGWAEGPPVFYDSVMLNVEIKYEDPYPLSEKYFLCSRMIGRAEQMGIYLLDIFGNEILLYTEAPGCYDPMPVKPRPRPAAMPHRRNFENNSGRFYVLNAYQGTHMKGVTPGKIKYLRVVEAPEKLFYTNGGWGGQGAQIPTMNWHNFENKRILGTVPVEADGSAFFEVPSDTFVYFQLLDKDKMMIQSMRSGTVIQSGETTGCIGCHEDRRLAPKNTTAAMPSALRREPSKLDGWYGPPREFNYLAEVQPVFDKHCMTCHDYGKEAAQKLNLARDRANAFNTSYTELWRKAYITAIGAGVAEVQQPYTWGAHVSKIVEVIHSDHNGVKLSVEEFERLTTWIDLNAPYYPHFSSAYPSSPTGRSPLTAQQIARLTRLTGVDFNNRQHSNHPGVRLTFDRPELSPCLDGFDDATDPNYIEALAIIQAGKDKLAHTPRADMPGYTPCEWHQQVQAEYDYRRDIELQNRQALRDKQKRYDQETR